MANLDKRYVIREIPQDVVAAIQASMRMLKVMQYEEFLVLTENSPEIVLSKVQKYRLIDDSWGGG